MEQAALPFDDIPMVVIIVGREIFHRPGHEIGDHGIQRHAFASDQDAGLAGGAESALHSLFAHRLIKREGGVHFPDRAIGAHGQDPLTAAFLTVCNGIFDAGHAHVMQGCAIRLGGGDQIGFVAQQVV